MEDDPGDTGAPPPESLLPYEAWTEQAMRRVAVQALKHAAREGLPGEHHFYLTFRTDHPGTIVPPRLKTQYPQEMTIVLQHQFWDLAVSEFDAPGSGQVSIGLSFGGVPSTLVIPIAAITAFADPHARFGVRFRYEPPAEPDPQPEAAPEAAAEATDTPTDPTTPQVVSLDAFRRRTPPRDS